MTIIVYAKDVLASDSAGLVGLQNWASHYETSDKVRLTPSKTVAYGVSGADPSARSRQKIETILELKLREYESLEPDAEYDSTPLKKLGFSFIAMTATGVYFVDESSFRICSDVNYISLGTGCRYANVALGMDKTAKEAVQLAIKLDKTSGGKPVLIKRSQLKSFINKGGK